MNLDILNERDYKDYVKQMMLFSNVSSKHLERYADPAIVFVSLCATIASHAAQLADSDDDTTLVEAVQICTTMAVNGFISAAAPIVYDMAKNGHTMHPDKESMHKDCAEKQRKLELLIDGDSK